MMTLPSDDQDYASGNCMSATLTAWRKALHSRMDRVLSRTYPDHKHPAGSSTVTGRTFHF